MSQALLDRYASTLGNQLWRLNNLYTVIDKEGRSVKFEMNAHQEAFYHEMWYCNLILKARQLGYTTFVQIFFLDQALFTSNTKCGVIAHTLRDAQIIFHDKLKHAYSNLPEQIQAARPLIRDSAMELVFSNDSSVRVGVSMRSGTLNYLHISELGKIAAKHPDKAKEIRTGALNTVQAGQVVIVESTAEGQDGDFYKLTEKAQEIERMGKELSMLDYRFHFAPWWKENTYRLDPDSVLIDAEAEKYFDFLEREHGILLDAEQKAWWVKKQETQQDEMGREFPSFPGEAFAAAVDGSYYGKLIAKAEKEGRVGDFPATPGYPVQTFHDIGVSLTDYHSIWFAQFLPGEIRHLHFYQNSGEGMPFYADYIAEQYQKNGWIRGDEGYDWFPHDGRVKEWGTGKTRLEQAKEKGLRPRIPTAMTRADGINAVRAIIPVSTFDAKGCAEGIKVLKNYKKKWNDKTGAWMSEPLHNEASHGADAERTLAMAHREVQPPKEPEKPKSGLTTGAMRDEMMRHGHNSRNMRT